MSHSLVKSNESQEDSEFTFTSPSRDDRSVTATVVDNHARVSITGYWLCEGSAISSCAQQPAAAESTKVNILA